MADQLLKILYYLYAVLRAANEVKEFRFRTDKNGQVVYHDQVDIISPIAVPGKTFYTVRIPYHADFERFYAEAYHIVHNIPEEGDPYGAEKVITEQKMAGDLKGFKCMLSERFGRDVRRLHRSRFRVYAVRWSVSDDRDTGYGCKSSGYEWNNRCGFYDELRI